MSGKGDSNNLVSATTTDALLLSQYLTITTSCLGHSLTFQGMYRDGMIVLGATKALTSAMPRGCRFVLMGSAGVENPDMKTDPIRPFSERCLLFIIRWLVPPHWDNEQAAMYLHQHRDEVDWSVVRPPELIDGEASDYDVFPCPQGSLFGTGVSTRANVAHFMVRLAIEPETWSKYKHHMPTLYDKQKPETATPETGKSQSVLKKGN
jgi:NAD(P)H-binding